MLGATSGKLTVVAAATGPVAKRAYWLCQCACGGTRVVMGKYLRSNEVKSCGCLNRTSLVSRQTHGLTPAGAKTPRVYNTWAAMKSRCLNPTHPKWHRYGGRGITVCKRWMKFEGFYADMGDPPIGATLDRKDNDKDYSKSNCRWATPKQQANNMDCNRWIVFKRKKKTLTGWAEFFGVPASTLHGRLRRMGMPAAMNYYQDKK